MTSLRCTSASSPPAAFRSGTARRGTRQRSCSHRLVAGCGWARPQRARARPGLRQGCGGVTVAARVGCTVHGLLPTECAHAEWVLGSVVVHARCRRSGRAEGVPLVEHVPGRIAPIGPFGRCRGCSAYSRLELFDRGLAARLAQRGCSLAPRSRCRVPAVRHPVPHPVRPIPATRRPWRRERGCRGSRGVGPRASSCIQSALCGSLMGVQAARAGGHAPKEQPP